MRYCKDCKHATGFSYCAVKNKYTGSIDQTPVLRITKNSDGKCVDFEPKNWKFWIRNNSK